MKQAISSNIKKEFFDKLDERQKRSYAAIEAISQGYGGQSPVLEPLRSALVLCSEAYLK